MIKKLSVEYATLTKRLVLRFARVFAGGGLAALSVQLIVTPELATFSDLGTWFTALGVAFIAGGIVALEKWNRE